ncbi:hypothetical protein POKO110462_22240 [Pontibacter korlensis]|uniref:Uncharacterized protein n=1 Tax=Pontibacter korlensis TaxID=400092 RepID=A0A0E3ZJD9_9BACT|nr:hypothetical protein [Pontibacter korlensis]AKD05173.1 hypothetical protein PKOR_21515 [Pontibacter korlensis]
MSNERDNRYYHEGLGADGNRRNFDRDTRDGDFGREHQDRYRHGNNPHDFRNRRDFDANRFENYPRRDHDMEDNYYENTRRDSHSLSNIRQGYGFSSFDDSSDPGNDMENMRRERGALQDQGYGSGRLSGYSGSGFGGANYSSHGDFGGSPQYGSMSGDRGNINTYVSSSGYGGGHSNASMHPDQSTHSDRGEPNYMGPNRNPREQEGFSGRSRGNSNSDRERGGGYGSGFYSPDNSGLRKGNRTDRGGYINQDPNC